MAIADRRERERAQRHERIIAAARQLAEAEGWDAVTTQQLADSIEYSQPVLYSHFENKDAIVAAVAVQGFAELADILRSAADNVSSPTRHSMQSCMRMSRSRSTNPRSRRVFRSQTFPSANPNGPRRYGRVLPHSAPWSLPSPANAKRTPSRSSPGARWMVSRCYPRGRLNDGADEARLTMLTSLLIDKQTPPRSGRRPAGASMTVSRP